MSKTWVEADDDPGSYYSTEIVCDGSRQEVEVLPVTGVKVRIPGESETMLTAAEARQMAALLIKAAKRIERGKGYAR